MKSKTSNTVELRWTSPLDHLTAGRKPSPTVEKLTAAGIATLLDLLWILPLRISKTPEPRPFRDAHLDELFKGSGKVLHVDVKPAFGRRGKGNILLYNGNVVLKDDRSSETLSLRWFNLYPNQKKQIEALERIAFLGQVQEYKAQRQVINPQLIDPRTEAKPYVIEYPTVNKVSGTHLRKVFDLIPRGLWDDIPETLPALGYDAAMGLGQAFKVIHGKLPPEAFTPKLRDAAEERLVYEEFLIDQLKIQARRKFIKKKPAPVLALDEGRVADLVHHLPFELTADQRKVFDEIVRDLRSGHPMMRMVQGDVGCGKTIVAFLAARVANKAGHQVALMCPTEALATQHFESFRALNPALTLDLLLGSTKAKEKKEILKRMASGETEIVVGTHSLFQDAVTFAKLGLAVIDEQHKFGVEQRLRLVAKGAGAHCLIMTATPIPRTLSLAQYGDLDISSIRMMPAGRRGIKTRITEPVNYGKYLEFVRARLALGEQAYFVFPAIEESETADLQNVKESAKKYRELLAGFRVGMLHGQLPSEEKEATVRAFRDRELDVLVATSVIEVGINVPNATIISIYNPERFGLSSLHQLRGRVGRGDKPGFCFLVLDKELPPEAYQRLAVIEKNLDGFVIAEEDLRFRGEGDLFGVDQSGTTTTKKLANFLTHTAILERVVRDVEELQASRPELLAPHFERLAKDQKILDTI
jgi:ATP-dependent DNA helicase RecG